MKTPLNTISVVVLESKIIIKKNYCDNNCANKQRRQSPTAWPPSEMNIGTSNPPQGNPKHFKSQTIKKTQRHRIIQQTLEDTKCRFSRIKLCCDLVNPDPSFIKSGNQAVVVAVIVVVLQHPRSMRTDPEENLKFNCIWSFNSCDSEKNITRSGKQKKGNLIHSELLLLIEKRGIALVIAAGY